MADQPTTPSGSRWEPTDDDADRPLPAPQMDDPAAEERRTRLRGRAILAGAATALTLGGGLTGFVIGHSTAGDGNDGFRPARFSGPPGTGRFDDQGQQGQQGQQGPPSFRGPGAGSDDSGSNDDPT
jgi:hypothetical protein